MTLLSIHQPSPHILTSYANSLRTSTAQPHYSSSPPSLSYFSERPKFPSLKSLASTSFFPARSNFLSNRTFNLLIVSQIGSSVRQKEDDNSESQPEYEDLSPTGPIYKNTLELVECSMFAALSGLVFFLSNALAIENYFSCFFSLPIVISSMRWGVAAGRKTMVATFMVLFVLSGPWKAVNFLLKHGIVGFTMGTLWRFGVNWKISIFLCTIVRSFGAVGFVLTSSFLIRENILQLIAINIHASLTFALTAIGRSAIPSMESIYILFGILVLVNSGCFMFLLHLLYSVFIARLGMRNSLRLPKWLERVL